MVDRKGNIITAPKFLMKYKVENPISKKKANEVFAARDVEKICATLVSISLNDSDWQWVQNRCLEFLNHDNFEIRGLAATCLGHIARVHGRLDEDKVVVALRERLSDKEIVGRVVDALEDIEMFLIKKN